MDKKTHLLHYIKRSGFVRSIFVRVLAIFLVVSIAIAAIAFFSFTSEISRNIISERRHQLAAVEETISKRMEEITSIAYNIGADRAFYLEPVEGDVASDYEMSNTLARYLVGNSFIEHLAYYRIAEPDKIYISSGARSFSEFFMTSFGMSKEAAEANIRAIQGVNKTEVRLISYGDGKNAYFSYLYPLPQLAAKPQAYVLMLIPVKQVAPLLETLLMNSKGEAAVFDASGNEIYRMGALDADISLAAYAREGGEEAYTTLEGTRYVMQKVVSDSNGWIYVSAIRQSDTLSGLANKQLIVIILLLLLVFVAVVVILLYIVNEYKPISNLAATVAGGAANGGEAGGVMDERVLLSNTIATLQDDSEQKQKFETAYHEAEAASKAKSAFLSNMSHDIRTPMNAVIGMTAIALKHADEPDYVRDCLRKVQSSSRYLLDIINNVLDMSRIESGRFTLSEEVINLPALIDGLVSILTPSVEAKAQKLSVEIGDMRREAVVGDNVRLMQVLLNILANAVKFTPEGGEIRLSMRQTPSDDFLYGDYVFIVSDNGIGMSPEFIGEVFDTFSRAKGTDISKVEGTGLGMAIAKNLVELMGGTITCESELGKGTTFTVTMHMRFADAKDAFQSGGGRTGMGAGDAVIELAGKRILLVEDNAINREIAHRMIEETHAEVVEAENGRAAVDAFVAHPAGYFDLILMDIQMPIMSGYEATTAIRALRRADSRTIPIYAMTANTFDEDVRQVKDAGMNGHIGKPYTPETLYRVLARALIKS